MSELRFEDILINVGTDEFDRAKRQKRSSQKS